MKKWLAFAGIRTSVVQNCCLKSTSEPQSAFSPERILGRPRLIFDLDTPVWRGCRSWRTSGSGTWWCGTGCPGCLKIAKNESILEIGLRLLEKHWEECFNWSRHEEKPKSRAAIEQKLLNIMLASEDSMGLKTHKRLPLVLAKRTRDLIREQGNNVL